VKQLSPLDELSERAGARRAGNGQLSTQAYEHVREMIMSGAFPPSVPLREVDLVRLLEMSRTPVREALQRLEAEGLIEPLTSGGYVAIELGQKELADIYQVREYLTGLAARLAAANRSRVDLARLEDTLDAMEAAAAEQDTETLDSSIRTFFHALSDASKNAYLHSLNAKLVDFFRYHALAVTHPEWRDMARRDIRLIVDAIAARDGERAEVLARAHIAKALARRRADLEEKQKTAAPQGG
jgi:DNA-binding GntR family transcriptional regulator